MRDIGKNIKQIRTERDLTQDALAEQLFVTRQTVSNYETGKSRPDIDMLLRIAEALEVDINTILYGPQPKDQGPVIRLAAAGGAALVLGLLQPLLIRILEEAYYEFNISPWTPVYLLARPLFYALLGWTVVQGIGILLKAQVPRFRFAVTLRRAILGLCALTAALAMAYFLDVPWPQWFRTLTFCILVILSNMPQLSLLTGIALWLCGFPAAK